MTASMTHTSVDLLAEGVEKSAHSLGCLPGPSRHADFFGRFVVFTHRDMPHWQNRLLVRAPEGTMTDLFSPTPAGTAPARVETCGRAAHICCNTQPTEVPMPLRLPVPIAPVSRRLPPPRPAPHPGRSAGLGPERSLCLSGRTGNRARSRLAGGRVRHFRRRLRGQTGRSFRRRSADLHRTARKDRHDRGPHHVLRGPALLPARPRTRSARSSFPTCRTGSRATPRRSCSSASSSTASPTTAMTR